MRRCVCLAMWSGIGGWSQTTDRWNGRPAGLLALHQRSRLNLRRDQGWTLERGDCSGSRIKRRSHLFSAGKWTHLSLATGLPQPAYQLSRRRSARNWVDWDRRGRISQNPRRKSHQGLLAAGWPASQPQGHRPDHGLLGDGRVRGSKRQHLAGRHRRLAQPPQKWRPHPLRESERAVFGPIGQPRHYPI